MPLSRFFNLSEMKTCINVERSFMRQWHPYADDMHIFLPLHIIHPSSTWMLHLHVYEIKMLVTLTQSHTSARRR